MQRQDYATLAVLFATLFLAVADNQIVSPILPLLSHELGVRVQWLGQLVSGYALASGLVAFGLSPWSDRLGRAALIRWALLLFAFSSTFSSLATGFATLLFARLLTGISAGVLSFNIIALVGDRFAYAERGQAMGIVYSAYFAALMAGVPAGSWIADGLGWRAVFLGGSILALLLFGTASRWLPDPEAPKPTASESPAGAGWKTVGAFFRDPSSARGILASFLVSGGIVSILTYLGAWLNQQHGLSTRQIGSLYMISGLAALLASPLCGYLADHIGKLRSFVVGNSAVAVCILLLPWIAAGPPLVILFFLLSLAAAMRQSPFEAIITEIVGTQTRGRYIALRNMFSQVGIATAVFFGGWLYERNGYVAVGLLAAGMTGLASWIMPRVGEKP